MSRLAIKTLAAALVLVTATASRSGLHAQQPVQSFAFGVFGDHAYKPEQEPQLENLLVDINRINRATPLAFVVNIGDLGSPKHKSCTNEFMQRRYRQFQTLELPLIYTPGDNDWTDCHGPDVVSEGSPRDRLDALRKIFFADEGSLGHPALALTRQSQGQDKGSILAKYRENARWDFGGITFVTLHVVGSNNNRESNKSGGDEFNERNKANLDWLHEGFTHAVAVRSRAIVIFQQANMYPEFTPFTGEGKKQTAAVAKSPPTGYVDMRHALEKEAKAFENPVVLVHGDSHYFRVDRPYMWRKHPDGYPVIENVTRVETFGEPYHHWVSAVADLADPNVFTFRPRIVEANRGLAK